MKQQKVIKLVLLLIISIYSQSNAQFDFFESKTTIGSYGELHYNYKNQNDDISKTLDFHRFVLFSDIRFPKNGHSNLN